MSTRTVEGAAVDASVAGADVDGSGEVEGSGEVAGAAVDASVAGAAVDASVEGADVVASAVHVPSAVYVARLVLAALGVLPLSRCTLDFGTGDGVALHVFLGLLAVCAWRAAQAAVNALFDDFAAWRWSMGAVARADHNRA